MRNRKGYTMLIDTFTYALLQKRYAENFANGLPPYQGVTFTHRDEINYVLAQRGWVPDGIAEEQIDLRGAIFASGGNFRSLNLRAATLRNGSVEHCDFRLTDLANADMSESTWHNVDLTAAHLLATQWYNATVTHCHFDDANLAYSTWDKAYLSGSFYGASLDGVGFSMHTVLSDFFVNATTTLPVHHAIIAKILEGAATQDAHYAAAGLIRFYDSRYVSPWKVIGEHIYPTLGQAVAGWCLLTLSPWYAHDFMAALPSSGQWISTLFQGE